MNVGTMTSKGQITIPAAIRELVGLEPGIQVEFVVTPDGAIQLWPLNGTAEGFFTALEGFEKTEFSGNDEEAIAEAFLDYTSPRALVNPEHSAPSKPRGSRPRPRKRAA